MRPLTNNLPKLKQALKPPKVPEETGKIFENEQVGRNLPLKTLSLKRRTEVFATKRSSVAPVLVSRPKTTRGKDLEKKNLILSMQTGLANLFV